MIVNRQAILKYMYIHVCMYTHIYIQKHIVNYVISAWLIHYRAAGYYTFSPVLMDEGIKC